LEDLRRQGLIYPLLCPVLNAHEANGCFWASKLGAFILDSPLNARKSLPALSFFALRLFYASILPRCFAPCKLRSAQAANTKRVLIMNLYRMRKYPIKGIRIYEPSHTPSFFVTFDIVNEPVAHVIHNFFSNTVFREAVEPHAVLFVSEENSKKKWQLGYHQTAGPAPQSIIVVKDPYTTRQAMLHQLVEAGYLDKMLAQKQAGYNPKSVPSAMADLIQDAANTVRAAATGDTFSEYRILKLLRSNPNRELPVECMRPTMHAIRIRFPSATA
jgi:hypothetical protein